MPERKRFFSVDVFPKFLYFGAVTCFTTSELHPSRFCPFFLHLCFSMFFFLLIRWSQETHLNVNLRHHMHWWWCYYWWFWCWWRWCWWTESWHQGMKNSFDAQRAKLSGSSPAWIIDNDESDGNDGVGDEYWIVRDSDDTHYDKHVIVQQWWLWYWWI